MQTIDINHGFLEQSILGAILKDCEQFVVVHEILTPWDFTPGKNREIYKCMIELANNSVNIDCVTVEQSFSLKGVTNEMYAYLVEIALSISTASHALDYAINLKDANRRIRFEKRIQEVLAMHKEGEPLDSLLVHADHAIQEISSDTTSDKGVMLAAGLKSFSDELQDMLEGKSPLKLDTGFNDLDNILGGMRAGNLIILGGRPSMGKTTFMLNIVRNILVKEKKPILLFSFEMPPAEIIRSLIACTASIPLQHLKELPMPDSSFTKISVAMDLLHERELKIMCGNSSIANVKLQCRKFKRTYPSCALIVIDYIGLMSAVGTEGRVMEITTISRELKLLAMELEIPILVLSQLNRKIEDGSAKREPQLSDLRDSGSVEQDADIVMFVHKNKEIGENITTVYIRKNRSGRCDNVNFVFEGHIATFRQMSFGNVVNL